MFKSPILRRSFSLFRRGIDADIVRSASRSGHDTIKIQRVRFKKPIFTRRQLIKYTLYTSGFYFSYRAFHFILFEDDDEEDSGAESRPSSSLTSQRNSGSATGKGRSRSDGEDSYEFPTIFLPTGFARPKKQEYYKGSDPEWQEFCKISSDPVYRNEVVGTLVDHVRAFVARAPHIKRQIGEVELDSGWHWIGIVYPDGPTPEMERPGYEIDLSLNAKYTTKTVSPVHTARLKRVLWPDSAATSLYQLWKERAGWAAGQVKNYVIPGKSAVGGENEGLQKAQRPVQAPAPLTPTMPLSRSGPNPSSTSKPQDNSPASTTASSDIKSTEASTSRSPLKGTKSPPPNTDATSTLYSKIPSAIKPTITTVDLKPFWRAWLNRKWSPGPPHLPRGAIRVDGQVEVRGTAGIVVMDVIAVYDTKTHEYISILLAQRRIMKYSQQPRGGP